MVPVVTPEEMGAIDRSAPEPVDVLIGRAGGAVARAAVDLLGGRYGRRVVVVAGKGNNGNDGREAARRLRALGVRVTEVAAVDAPQRLPDADLVIDAAFGTGFRGSYRSPQPADPATPVLAVDIPSGVSGLTGEVDADTTVLTATRTVTFAALKPGLLLEPGATLAGEVSVADIGLDASAAPTNLLEDADVAGWFPSRPASTHKWRSAVWLIAGSPGMAGAASLACLGAQRAGAGYVRLSTPGGVVGPGVPEEVVQMEVPGAGWAGQVLSGQDRFRALVVGNGLGLEPSVGTDVRAVVSGAEVPVVVDADGLTALGRDAAAWVRPDTVVTPHDGEFARLAGAPPGADRIAETRRLAEQLGCVVLLKGSLTTVAGPDGRVLLSRTGDARLATAGTGDVLAGIIGALCAQGVPSLEAAALGAFLHGRAGALGWRHGLVAGDLPRLLPTVIDGLTEPDDRG